MSTFPCPQLSDLDTALAPLPWSDVKRMAIQLHSNLTLSTLDQIEEDRSKVGERRLYCMDVWLKIDCEASWTKLVTALDKIGQNELARKIESRHCVCLPKSDTCVHTNTYTESPTACRAQLDSACLLAPTPKDRESTEGTVVRDYADNDEVQGVLEQFSDLQQRFVSLVTKVQIHLCEKEGKFLLTFRITLINLPLSDKYKHMYFLKEKRAVIKAAIDVDEIFEILSPYWNHVDYGLLEYIVNEFAKGNDVQLEMKTYISDLTQFEKGTTIQSYVDAMCANHEIPSEFRDVIIEMGRKPTECTLYDIRQFQKCLACRASVNAYSFYRKKVETGSVVVTLAVPNDVVDMFVKVVKDLQLEKDSHILSVRVNEGTLQSFTSTVLHESTTSASPENRRLPPPYNPPPPYRRKSVLRRLSHILKRLLVPRVMTSGRPEYSQESDSDTLLSPETFISDNEYNQENALPCDYNLDSPQQLHSESQSGLSDADSLSCPPSLVVSSISDKEKRDGTLDDGSISSPPSPALSTNSDRDGHGTLDDGSISSPPSPALSTISDKEKRYGTLHVGSISCPQAPAIFKEEQYSNTGDESLLHQNVTTFETSQLQNSTENPRPTSLQFRDPLTQSVSVQSCSLHPKNLHQPFLFPFCPTFSRSGHNHTTDCLDMEPSDGEQNCRPRFCPVFGDLIFEVHFCSTTPAADFTAPYLYNPGIPSTLKVRSKSLHSVFSCATESGYISVSCDDYFSNSDSQSICSSDQLSQLRSPQPYSPRIILKPADITQEPTLRQGDRPLVAPLCISRSLSHSPRSHSPRIFLKLTKEQILHLHQGDQQQVAPVRIARSLSHSPHLYPPRLFLKVKQEPTQHLRLQGDHRCVGPVCITRSLSHSPHYRSPRAVPMHTTCSAKPSILPPYSHHFHHSPPPAQSRLSNEPDGEGKEIIDEVLLMAVGCLMHQERCQIPNCPCRRVKERFQHILPQTRQHMQKEADQVVEEMQSGNFDPTSRRQQMRISLSSQNFSKDIHAHYHMTSRSHIRTSDGKEKFIQRRRSKSMDLTPVMEQPEPCAATPAGVMLPDIARGVLCGPAFSPAVTPAGETIRVLSPTTPAMSTITPAVLLREISLSADNLPSLCLNDCPMATTPLMQLGNRPLGSAVKSPLQWSASSSTKPTPVSQYKADPVPIKGRPTERFDSQDSSSSVQTSTTHSSSQSGRSEGTSVFDDYKGYDAQISTSTASTDPLEDSIRRKQFQLRGKQDEILEHPLEMLHVDSGYGTNGDITDGETSLTRSRAPPSDLQLSPPSVPAKQKKPVAKEQPKHLHPTTSVSKPVVRRGSTSSHGSHTSHLSVGSHISHASDGSITTETLC